MIDTSFWDRVLVGDGCWEWQGVRNPRTIGYGQLKRNGKTVRAHRVAYEMWFGLVPEGLGVLHRCDNPPCVRPDHLFVGSQHDNATDRFQKGRWAPNIMGKPARCLGESNGNAKLTRTAVAEIRSAYAAGGVTLKELAARFNVAKSTIHRVVRDECWNG